MNKTYGILMSGEMVRAYYKLRLKTETRRTRGLDTINRNPHEWNFLGFSATKYAIFERVVNRRFGEMPGTEQIKIRPPYGWVGDTLWFKETYAPMCHAADFGYCTCETEEEENRNHYIEYKADTGNPYPGDWPEEEAKGNPDAPKWHSSMFMKHKHSRFKDIPILDVKIERLQDISFKDAFNEGCPRDFVITPITWYFELWDKLNGDKLPAKVNPFVWVYQFPRYGDLRRSGAEIHDLAAGKSGA